MGRRTNQVSSQIIYSWLRHFFVLVFVVGIVSILHVSLAPSGLSRSSSINLHSPPAWGQSSSSSIKESSIQEHYDIRDSVFRVLTNVTPGVETSYGTGFILTYEGKTYIITNEHVCAQFPHMYYENRRGRFKGRVLRKDANLDLCSIEVVSGVRSKPLEMVPRVPHPGALVISIGYPHGKGPLTSMGTLLAYEGQITLGEDGSDTSIMPVGRMSNTVIPGQSGSPVLDESKKVIGVVYANLQYGMGVYKPYGLFLPRGYLIKFFRDGEKERERGK